MIKQIVATIENFLIKNESEFTDVRKNFNDITTGIELLNDDKPVEDIENIINESKEVMKTQMDQFLDIPLSKEYMGFLTALSKLLYNFNINTSNDTDLSLFCKLSNKMIELVSFTKVVIEIEKKANIVINQWKNFNPPALSISNALLEEVLKDE